ncbi:hypothetical protein [Limnohabitans sp. T6-5]|uniref:hypothetical protein n=1 Tax=Limnohabitans sp. T6-5 TaxID=1100724 RepID=UPI0011B25DBA|nr:hypothetical protein [Limnohabitans sp. T6-5]
MPIFVVISLAKDTGPLNAAVVSAIPEADRHQLVNDRGWLVRFDGTSTGLSGHLEITGQSEGEKSRVGAALVTPISAYYGRGPNDMWEWLSVKFSQ